MAKQLAQIDRGIAKIKAEQQELHVVRPGSLTRGYRNRPEKMEAFYPLVYRHRMKSKTEHVRKALVDNIRGPFRDYRRFTKLIER